MSRGNFYFSEPFLTSLVLTIGGDITQSISALILRLVETGIRMADEVFQVGRIGRKIPGFRHLHPQNRHGRAAIAHFFCQIFSIFSLYGVVFFV